MNMWNRSRGAVLFTTVISGLAMLSKCLWLKLAPTLNTSHACVALGPLFQLALSKGRPRVRKSTAVYVHQSVMSVVCIQSYCYTYGICINIV